MAHYLQEAIHKADSFALLLYAPDMVYTHSKRPRNSMAMFRMATSTLVARGELQPVVVPHLPGAVVLPEEDPTKLLLPVTRYTAGMSKGLYMQGSNVDSQGKEYCGTFYYLEPESTTFLFIGRHLVARNKSAAVHALELELGMPVSPLYNMFPEVTADLEQDGKLYLPSFQHPWLAPDQAERLARDLVDVNQTIRELRARDVNYLLGRMVIQRAYPETHTYFPGVERAFREPYNHSESPLAARYLLGIAPELPEDLLMTPNEVHTVSPRWGWTAAEVATLPQDRRYAGVLMGFYANEDFLDQYVCKLARQAGYEVVVLTHMVGSHQVVTEVLDTRARTTSFHNLVYTAAH